MNVRARSAEVGFIYAIQTVPDIKSDRLKLGWSQHPPKRLKGMLTESPTAQIVTVFRGDRSLEQNVLRFAAEKWQQISKEVFDVGDVSTAVAMIDNFLDNHGGLEMSKLPINLNAPKTWESITETMKVFDYLKPSEITEIQSLKDWYADEWLTMHSLADKVQRRHGLSLGSDTGKDKLHELLKGEGLPAIGVYSFRAFCRCSLGYNKKLSAATRGKPRPGRRKNSNPSHIQPTKLDFRDHLALLNRNRTAMLSDIEKLRQGVDSIDKELAEYKLALG